MTSQQNFPQIAAVVFDWAGTLVDFGSCAPTRVFQAIFEQAQVPISDAEARAPMGLPKLDHIKAIGTDRAVRERWQKAHGAAFTDADADRLYKDFLPLQIDTVGAHATLIPGVPQMAAALRQKGIKLGGTTGYTRDIMDVVTEGAKAQGFIVDALTCTGEEEPGRPGPGLLLRTLMTLDVYPPHCAVKVGDTPADMAEGRTGGCWTVGYTLCGSLVGLTAEDLTALPDTERRTRHDAAEETLRAAGAHFVIEGPHALVEIVDQINGLLRAGVRPN